MNVIQKLFHTHKLELDYQLIAHPNKGEVWYATCKCGQRKLVYFTPQNRCISITDLSDESAFNDIIRLKGMQDVRNGGNMPDGSARFR
jgi:hypothetical protein